MQTLLTYGFNPGGYRQGWNRVKNAKSESWWVNYDGLTALALAYCRMQSMLKNTRVNPVSVSIAPFLNVQTISVDINWDAVNSSLLPATFVFYQDGRLSSPANYSSASVDYLVQVRRETRRMTSILTRILRDASDYNQANYAAMDSDLAAAMAGARFVRDASIKTFMVVAGGLTGGAALAVYGIGSVAAGAAEYQDNGNIGAAAVTIAGTFVTAVIPIAGKTLGTSVGAFGVKVPTKLIVIASTAVATFATDATTGFIDGRSLQANLAHAFTDAALSMIPSDAANKLTKLAMPVQVTWNLIAPPVAEQAVVSGLDLKVDAATSDGGPALSATRLPSPISSKFLEEDSQYIGQYVLKRAAS